METEKQGLDEIKDILKLHYSTHPARYFVVIGGCAFPVSGERFLNLCANAQNCKEHVDLWEKTGLGFEYLGSFKY